MHEFKFIKKLVLVIGGVLFMNANVTYAQGMESMSLLHTEGVEIKNAEGETLILRGTNIGGWLVLESWMTPINSPYQKRTIEVFTERFGESEAQRLMDIYEDHYFTEKDLDVLSELGVNALRLPFSYMNLCNLDGTLKDEPWTRLDWFVENCQKRGIYVILDLHGAMGSQNGNDHSGDASDGARLFSNEAYMNHTVWLWEQIAEHYVGNYTIAGYDILNEPGGPDNTTTKMQWDLFDRIYKAIRGIDKEHIIIMESCWEPKNLPNPKDYGWENIVYEYHNYCWNADNDYIAQQKFVDKKIRDITNSNHNVPVFIGEFTAFINESAWEYTLGKYNEAGYSWTTWTYKVTGQSSWGIVNQSIDRVDIEKDTAKSIEEKWLLAGESTINKVYYDVISRYIDGNTEVPELSQPAPTFKPYPTLAPKEEMKVMTYLKHLPLPTMGIGIAIGLAITGIILMKKKRR